MPAKKPDAPGAESPPAVTILQPRLVDTAGAGLYLGGISSATVRALVADGLIEVVHLPAVSAKVRRRGESMRRTLFDVRDLDRLVDKWK